MNLLAAVLAEHAVAHEDSTFSITKGGINEVSADSYPALVRLFLVLRVQLQPEEVGQLHRLTVRITHEGLREMASVRTPMVVNPADPTRPAFINVVGQLNLVLPWPGEYIFEALIDEDIRLPLLSLLARHTGVGHAPAPPAPPPVSGS